MLSVLNLFKQPLISNSINFNQVRFASKKAGGSTSNYRGKNPKYRGFKKLQGAMVEPGNIILRQKGTKWHPGTDVGMGKDFTIFALVKGRVMIHYDLARQRRFVSVDDGTRDKFYSRVELKRKLGESIDPSHYLTLSANERYDYVMKKVADLTKSMEQEKAENLKEKLTQQGRRRFLLKDLTLL
ncbi:hypothetical protein HDV04_003376 [Boothiomyces sp. JEL0838]|nr:hypothetical protein HDV04_003376 [Boothiomyces sp. JEL0838]